MTDWSPKEKRRIQIIQVAMLGNLGIIAFALLATLWIPAAPTVTSEEHRYGLAPNHAEIAAPYVAAAPPFQILTADGRPVVKDNSKVNARLWEVVRKIECPGKPFGEDWENIPQEIGDCVSWGYCDAGNATLGVMAADQGGGDPNVRPQAPRGPPRLSTMWVYYGSRVVIGRGQLGNSDGSVGAWAAQFGEEVGLITVADPGVPPYNGQTAREWGRRGPPQELLRSLNAIAKDRKAMKRAPVRNATEAMDALANYYGVTIASSRFGTSRWLVQDGRRVAVDNENWGHQQSVIGYDGSSPSGKRYFCVHNSWGPNWGPEPMQGEPRGTYWITWEQMDSICREGDSWVITGINGLVEQQLNWSIIRSDIKQQPFKLQPMKEREANHDVRITTLPAARQWAPFVPDDAGMHDPFRAPVPRVRTAASRPAEARLVRDPGSRDHNNPGRGDSSRTRASDRTSY